MSGLEFHMCYQHNPRRTGRVFQIHAQMGLVYGGVFALRAHCALRTARYF